MKKIVLAIFAFAAFPLFAEIQTARRYIEVGVSADVMVAQNIMPLADILKKNLVIDLQKVYSDMSASGATVSLSNRDEVYIDANFKSFGLGVHVAAEVGSSFNISKDLFKVLDGVVPGQLYQADASVWLESFATVSVPVRVNINKWKVKVTPTYFVPLLYVPATTVTGYAVNGLDGSVTAMAKSPLDFYTISEFEGLIKDGDFSTDFVDNIDSATLLSDMANSGGFDLSASVEYAFTEKFDLGGYITMPIVPGRLKHKVSTIATAYAHSKSIMQMVFDDEEADADVDLSDAVYSDANYVVNRPLRFGVECAWRPFGKWLVLRGMGGAALRNPFGEDVTIKSFYPEYKLGVELSAFGMLGINLSTQYLKKIFAHGFDLMFNFRAVEFDISAAISSPSFVQSFRGEGVCAGVGVKFGW